MAGRRVLRLPRRAGRRTNLGLLGLLLVAGSTGVLAYGIGTPFPARLVVAVHGAAGLGLLLLVPWKTVIVQRARRRPAGSRRPSGALLLTGVTAVTVLSGVLHAVGSADPWPPLGITALQVHVAAGALVAVGLGIHVAAHRPVVRAADASRRTFLRAGALALGAAALWEGGETALRLTGAPGSRRRATGSLDRGTGDPAAMPVTQWFTDTVPTAARESVVVTWRDRRSSMSLADLDRGDRVRAVLDCTGGWYADQDWSGIRLDRLLSDVGALLPAGGSVDVVSRTGYRRRLPIRDAGTLFLATSAGGRPLSAGHGAPVRLIAPGRRGFWWVKWVERIEVVDAPWWAQPPFPLQ